MSWSDTLLKDSLRVNGEIACYSAIEKISGYLLQGGWLVPEARVVSCIAITFSKAMKKCNPISSEEVLKGFLGFMLVSEFFGSTKVNQ